MIQRSKRSIRGGERKRTELLDTAKVLLLLPSISPKVESLLLHFSRKNEGTDGGDNCCYAATWWEMRVFLSFRARKRQATLLSKRGFPKRKGESTLLTFQCIRPLLHLFFPCSLPSREKLHKNLFSRKKNKFKFELHQKK